jgi:hypothetical protein
MKDNMISSIQGRDKYSDRHALVCKNAEGYYINCYDDKDLVKRIDVYKHSERYAEDAAENYVLGILNP